MPPGARAPQGFVRLDAKAGVVVVDPDFVDAATALGLLEPGGLARALARAPAGGPEGRGPVAILPLGSGEQLCLRRLRRGGLLASFRPAGLAGLARPVAELETTARLRAAGAPVPRPVLVAGALRPGGGWDAAVGTRFEADTVDALAFLVAEPDRESMLRASFAAGVAVRRFHDAGGRHADLHVKNLLIRVGKEAVEVLVIDLDRARVQSDVKARARLSEIMRLWRSLVKRGVAASVGPRGCARFLAGYTGGDRSLRRTLLAGLGRERIRLALHGLHYRFG